VRDQCHVYVKVTCKSVMFRSRWYVSLVELKATFKSRQEHFKVKVIWVSRSCVGQG